MNEILQYVFESLVYGAVLYAVYAFIVSKEKNYSFQRLYLVVSALCMLLFPLISIPVRNNPFFDITLSPDLIFAEYFPGVSPNDSEIGSLFSLSGVIGYVYFLAAFSVAVYMLLQLFRVYGIIKRGRVSKGNGYKLVSSAGVSAPFSLFNMIFINDKMGETERELVIAHELSHIKRGHSFDLILCNCSFIFLWFNPFFYYLRSSLIEIHEYQADRDVLCVGNSLEGYRKLLLDTQFGVSPYMSSNFNKSLTFKRFIKMENLEQKKAGFMAVAVSLLTLSLLFAITAFSQQSIAGSADGLDYNRSLTDTTKTKVVSYAEVMEKPKFLGEDAGTFAYWVSERMVYPEQAKKDSIQGRVAIGFVIDTEGNVTNISILSGSHQILNEEAIRAVSLSPAWTPGKENGKVVPVSFVMPLIFQLR